MSLSPKSIASIDPDFFEAIVVEAPDALVAVDCVVEDATLPPNFDVRLAILSSFGVRLTAVRLSIMDALDLRAALDKAIKRCSIADDGYYAGLEDADR